MKNSFITSGQGVAVVMDKLDSAFADALTSCVIVLDSCHGSRYLIKDSCDTLPSGSDIYPQFPGRQSETVHTCAWRFL